MRGRGRAGRTTTGAGPGAGSGRHGLLALGGDRREALDRPVGSVAPDPRSSPGSSRSPARLEHQQLVDDLGEPVDLRHAARRAPGRTSGSADSACASSRRSRSPASGVRSWCEASATKSRWLASSRRDALGHLVERARERALLGAALDRRARGRGRRRRRGRRPRRAACSGRATWRGDHRAGGRPSSSTTPPISTRPSDGAAHRAVHRGDALGDAHRAADVARVRQDRHGGGEDVVFERVAAARDLQRRCPPAPRRSPAGWRSRRRARRRPALSASTRPRRRRSARARAPRAPPCRASVAQVGALRGREQVGGRARRPRRPG